MQAIEETHINRTAGHGIGSEIYPVEGTVFGETTTLPELYRFFLAEYGRCTGKVYVDTDEGTKHVGYVFERRARYEDCAETYLHETWMTLGEHVPARAAGLNYS